jgi:hypothetical protein
MLQICAIHLELRRGCFEVVLLKNYVETLGAKHLLLLRLLRDVEPRVQIGMQEPTIAQLTVNIQKDDENKKLEER